MGRTEFLNQKPGAAIPVTNGCSRQAHVVAVQLHSCLPFILVASISAKNEITVDVEGPAGICRSVLVGLTRQSMPPMCREAVFQADDEWAVATATMGEWNGLPVADLTLVPVTVCGEES